MEPTYQNEAWPDHKAYTKSTRTGAAIRTRVAGRLSRLTRFGSNFRISATRTATVHGYANAETPTIMGTDDTIRSKISYTALTSPVRKFRDDIAFIRALAIISVLCFHFWPKIFGLGFLGVDIFFVLSGYLIMQILGQSTLRPCQKLVDFYYKRAKRICPLYYLIMLYLAGSAIFVYSSLWLTQFLPHFKSAILMGLNLELLAADGDYFAEDTGNLPFLHAWSLAVEMQFYLVAPLLYALIGLKVNCQCVGVLFSISIFVSSLYFQWTSTPITAFYHPYSRIWQFLAGMLASAYSKGGTSASTSLKISEKSLNIATIVLLLPILSVFLPYFGEIQPPNIFQFVVPISGSLFLLVSSYNSQINWARFCLNYIATISYSLYLVHYPVLRYTEYKLSYYSEKIPVSIIALSATVAISMLFHHLYEKPMLRETKANVAKNTLILFGVLLFFATYWRVVVKPEFAQNELVAANKKFSKSIYEASGGKWIIGNFSKTGGPWGQYQYLNNTGNLSIISVGNSWAAQQRYIIRKIFSPNMTTHLESFTGPGNAIVFHDAGTKTKIFWENMKVLKPNIVFILMRYHEKAGDMAPYVPGNDTVLEHYVRQVERFSKFASHIFVESHQPFYCDPANKRNNFLTRFMDRLQNGGNLTALNMPYNATAFAESPVRIRLKYLLERCPKCYLVNVEEPFIDKANNYVRTYDEKTKLAYFDNDCHLTPPALKMLEPQFEKAVHEAMPKYFPNNMMATTTTKPKRG